MDFSGTLAGGLSGSMHFGSDGDTIDINPIITSGTKIATFTVNAGTEEEVVYDLYAPDTLSWDDITDKPTLFSGSYVDLSNKPTLNGDVINGNMFTHHYSTNEQRIGTWIDGKPLYQKTIPITKTGTSTLVDISNLNIDMIVYCTGVEYPNNKSFFLTLNYHENSNWYCFLEVVGSDLGVYCSDSDYNGAPNVLATIQYTKTTDS